MILRPVATRFPHDEELQRTYDALRSKIAEKIEQNVYRPDNAPAIVASVANLVERAAGLYYSGEDKRELAIALSQYAVETLLQQGGVSGDSVACRAVLETLLSAPQVIESMINVVVDVSKGKLFWQKRSWWRNHCGCLCCCCK